MHGSTKKRKKTRSLRKVFITSTLKPKTKPSQSKNNKNSFQKHIIKQLSNISSTIQKNSDFLRNSVKFVFNERQGYKRNTFNNLQDERLPFVERLVTYRQGPAMDSRWWFWNFVASLSPLVFMAIFLEYQTREMEVAQKKIAEEARIDLLGTTDLSKVDFDDALIKSEINPKTSGIQKRINKQKIEMWRKEYEEQGSSADIFKNEIFGECIAYTKDSLLKISALLKEYYDTFADEIKRNTVSKNDDIKDETKDMVQSPESDNLGQNLPGIPEARSTQEKKSFIDPKEVEKEITEKRNNERKNEIQMQGTNSAYHLWWEKLYYIAPFLKDEKEQDNPKT